VRPTFVPRKDFILKEPLTEAAVDDAAGGNRQKEGCQQRIAVGTPLVSASIAAPSNEAGASVAQ
jgi:hypothetical protein